VRNLETPMLENPDRWRPSMMMDPWGILRRAKGSAPQNAEREAWREPDEAGGVCWQRRQPSRTTGWWEPRRTLVFAMRIGTREKTSAGPPTQRS